ncbi:MarR family winged helix-turn-helix transcriptional regulator [Antrihabitans sp. YC2-6]|uniref:MarR family winged helix-turn-helix transcriptional regulator n=1 Tax=Antrihabitans sp. YC2-6 TaxID=2799498 RepID=UPI0018F72274|nr:MarR family winged helix-turn-helix transcriptional regulator [Antrihabitans sp. YC2-6]MBJ8346295.1 winged helix-turn-helix transcriptional regulator [Antrihabitans sp. YC2-6]
MRKASEFLPDHMFALVEGVRRRLRRDLSALSAAPQPRGSHVRLLQLIPEEGIRITDFAALSGMTKQSLGEFVDAMETEGMVTSRRLATDRRVRLVVRTPLGHNLVEAADRQIAAVEHAWRAEVGPQRYDTMKEVLREIGAGTFDPV